MKIILFNLRREKKEEEERRIKWWACGRKRDQKKSLVLSIDPIIFNLFTKKTTKQHYLKNKNQPLFVRASHQYVQKIFHFAHLKPTFSVLNFYFYKTPTSVYLLYTFIQIKYLFL